MKFFWPLGALVAVITLTAVSCPGSVVPPPVVPDISVNPNELNFVAARGETEEKSIIISNEGNTNLVISEIGGVTEPFELIDFDARGDDVILAPDEQLELTIRFSPIAINVWGDELIVESNDPDEEMVTVPLTGAGLCGNFTIHLTDENLGEVPFEVPLSNLCDFNTHTVDPLDYEFTENTVFVAGFREANGDNAGYDETDPLPIVDYSASIAVSPDKFSPTTRCVNVGAKVNGIVYWVDVTSGVTVFLNGNELPPGVNVDAVNGCFRLRQL
ncbi:MAG: hypothetical protein HY459_01215 [Parcubacteria group bacterium]|nr:hypothetical protein [Parcubacteria group bacterium]